jgi:rhodanese-related sulfurtransferase
MGVATMIGESVFWANVTKAALTIVIFAVTNIAPQDVIQYIDDPNVVILDVRESYEYEPGHIPGAILMPYSSGVLAEEYQTLPTDKMIIVYCKSGGRSAGASSFLDGKGFTQIYNMTGGFSLYSSIPDATIETGPYEPSTHVDKWSYY